VLLLVLPGAVLGRVELVCRLGIAAEHVHVRRHRLAADHISAAGPGAVAVAGAVAARVGARRPRPRRRSRRGGCRTGRTSARRRRSPAALSGRWSRKVGRS
jgi:hypothetical protein